MNRVRERFGLRKIRGGGFHPQNVRERRDGERLGDGVIQTSLDLVVTLGRLGKFAVPGYVDCHRSRFFAGGIPRRSLGEGKPLVNAQVKRLTFADPELHDISNRLPVGHKHCRFLPCHPEKRGMTLSSMVSTSPSELFL